MNIIRILSTILYYLVFFTFYKYVAEWINPNILSLGEEGYRGLFVALALVWMSVVCFISEVHDKQQGLRADFFDYLFGRK
jgi:uncharacterized membrane protein required for colicin V production